MEKSPIPQSEIKHSKGNQEARSPMVIESSYLEKHIDAAGYNFLQLACGSHIPQYGDLFRFSVQNGKPEPDVYHGRFTYDITSRTVTGAELLSEESFNQALNNLSNPEHLPLLPPRLD